ncbi:unnamed protein product [Menidia menidia]|uniref:(Atlantic silverside) hypothetical protein n=1 Tax=Menidia menidia TaxID=238744 RepID=A0A8S4B1Z9_9TELE|nr:unnamed protein product [Menidia menidia]
MLSILRAAAAVWCVCLLSGCGAAYELQDTIHTLKEENLHLQHRLENLTGALRDLKHLLADHSKGVSAETHHMLEQALCLTEFHSAARPVPTTPGLLLTSLLVSVLLYAAEASGGEGATDTAEGPPGVFEWSTQKFSVNEECALYRLTSWMEKEVGLLAPSGKLCSRMQVCVSICLLPHMTSPLWLLILSGLAVASLLGLEDVFFSPQDQTVREGEAVFFQCVSGEASPPAGITWLKDGKVVKRGKMFQGEYGGGHQKKTSGTLYLMNVTLEDDGTYVCVTHNRLLNVREEKKSKPAKLTVLRVPRRLHVIRGPENITVATGTEVSLRCTVYGFPVPMVHWFKDGCLLLNCSTSFSLQNNGQLLTFRNVTREDEGWYHCEASNQKERIKSQSAFLLAAEMDWSFVQQPSDLTVRRGENVTLTCRPPHSRPEAQMSWFKNSQLFTPTAHATVLPTGDLFFHSIQVDDNGSYFCRASNTFLQRFLTSKRATLTVLAPPTVKLWPQVLTVPLGARAVLECEVFGHPLPSINWVKRGHSKQTGGKIAYGRGKASLHIQSVRSYDEAVYVCEASNKLGESHSTALLRVAVNPIIVTYVGQVSSKVGASVTLPCGAVGIRPITHSWTRGRAGARTPVGHTTDEHIDEEGALHFPRVKYSDAGEYFCTAENRAGRDQRRTVLTITDSSFGSTTRLPISSRKAVAELKMLSKSQPRLNRQTTSPAQSLITQMQPPILPPPPRPNFQSVELHTELPLKRHPLLFSISQPPMTRIPTPETTSEALSLNLQYLLTESNTAPSAHFQQQVSEELFPESTSQRSNTPAMFLESQGKEKTETQPSSKLRVGGPFGFLKSDAYMPTPTQSPVTQTEVRGSGLVTLTTKSQTESYLSNTHFYPLVTNTPPAHHGPTVSPNIKPIHSNPSPTPQQASKPPSHQSFTLNFLPKFQPELSTSRPFSLPPLSSVSEPRPSQAHGQFPTIASVPESQHRPQLPSASAPLQDTASSVSDSEVTHTVNVTDGLNATEEPSNSTELPGLLKRNTSQSPMTSSDPKLTRRSRPWLPVLEKHDVPIVVGVGVSLAFIFITVTFYSVVRKNEPVPTSRAGQRNSHYANGLPQRAFEDDECVSVVEQSPNTSDTRARPPGPGLITVQLEPTSGELEQLTQPTLDNNSVTVETYPEPIVDTKVFNPKHKSMIDPSFEEEKVCSLSQRSVQLHCAEDWTSSRGDDHSPCLDTLPPPSSLPSPSPSPSPAPAPAPASRPGEVLRSSVTLQSSEACVPPIQHSLSITHGSPPLLLSHHVSLGLTTVAVDVQLLGPGPHINTITNSTSVTAPLSGPPLAGNQDNDGRSTAKFRHSK